jgi:Ca2+ transporting ATPase
LFLLKPPIDKEILPKQIGNKTECGLLNFIIELGGNYENIRKINPEESFLHVYTFNSIRKLMATVIQRSDTIRLHMKGASEIVLQKCTKILNQNGEIILLTKNDYNHLLNNIIEPMACDGLRTICIAYKDFHSIPNDWNDETNIFEDLTCICICGIEDPVRPEVKNFFFLKIIFKEIYMKINRFEKQLNNVKKLV